MPKHLRVLVGLLLAAGIFFAGYLTNQSRGGSAPDASVGQKSIYICPMHPQYTSDHPGTCPICGMSLVLDSPGSHSAEAESPGTVRVNPEKQQLVGVRTDIVRNAPVSDRMRISGRVTVDESRLYRIVAAVDGWILKMEKNSAGTAVTRNEVLASYYTPTMMVTQQNFLYALGRGDQMGAKNVPLSIQRTSLPLNLESAIDNVRSLGMDDIQIQEIQESREYASEIKIHSPVDGYVIARNVSPDQRFDKGEELYAIADIKHIWVMADIFEKDREFLKPGARATVSYHGQRLPAKMSDTLPLFDPESRILKTRFELNNPGDVLLPDMFVDVELQVEKPAAITVPADAVVDSGRRKTVYVERTGGVFEPREVETGWRLGNRVQITGGLEEGERIVVAGNFLIDSESRMRQPDISAAAEMNDLAKDLVCGMTVDPNAAGTLKAEYKGKTYYFCSPMCKKNFEQNPEKYLKKTGAPETAMAKDPVCGMMVDPHSSDTLKTEYNGQTYYFCSAMCKKSFEANPEKYIVEGTTTHEMNMTGMEE